jgi:ABC-type uncharacterized transport system substrate-binding protein
LLSYGPSLLDLWRRNAIHVDKILRGARAAELPIEQPTKFELVINLKTAKICSGDARRGTQEPAPRVGYAAGDYVLDSRWAEGYDERLSSLAADLVRDKRDVIVTVGPLPAFAAARAENDPDRGCRCR